MSLYTDKARNIAIEHIEELYMKLAGLKPTKNFNYDDIRATMMYLTHFQYELKKEQKIKPTV